MDKLVTVQADYLLQQAKAGASALQIFDSWAGLALGRDDYDHYVLPFNRKLVEMVTDDDSAVDKSIEELEYTLNNLC